MNYGYIYKTTNLINDKIYIGKHKGEFDCRYFGSGSLLKRALKKYGRINFKVELLVTALDSFTLGELEEQHIQEYKQKLSKDYLYNLTEGGEHKKEYTPILSEETKKRMSVAAVGNKHALGAIRSLEFKEKLRKFRLGKFHSEETRKRNSVSNTGRIAWNKGKKTGPMPLETREKIRLSNLGKHGKIMETACETI